MKVSDRTIAYRLNIIEQLLGRPVRARPTELQAAIRLERAPTTVQVPSPAFCG